MNNVDVYGIMPQHVTSVYTTTAVRDGKITVEKTKHLETATGVTSVEVTEYVRYNKRGQIVPPVERGGSVDILV
jgi:hypothetical protein